MGGLVVGNVLPNVGTLPTADFAVALGEAEAVTSAGSAPVNQRGVTNSQHKHNAGRGENRGQANFNRGSFEALAEVPVQGSGGRNNAKKTANSGKARRPGSFEAFGNFCSFPAQTVPRASNGGQNTKTSNQGRTGTAGNCDTQNTNRTRAGTQAQGNTGGNSTSSAANNKPLLTNASSGNPKPKVTNASVGNGTNNAIAPSAADIAKDRSTMLSSVDKLLAGALGAGKYTKPKDHRGYTTLVNKAMKTLKTPAERTAFQNGIEAAGKPFRMNFGLSKQVNGKAVALNADSAGTIAQGYQAERGKFYQEFLGKTSTTGTATNNNARPVSNQIQNNHRYVAPNRTSTMAPNVVQNQTPACQRKQVPMNHTPANTRGVVPVNHTPVNPRSPLPYQAPSATPTNAPSIYNPRAFLIA